MGSLPLRNVRVVDMIPGDWRSGADPEIIAAVLRSEPDLTSLPADLPAPIRELIERCLEKGAPIATGQTVKQQLYSFALVRFGFFPEGRQAPKHAALRN